MEQMTQLLPLAVLDLIALVCIAYNEYTNMEDEHDAI